MSVTGLLLSEWFIDWLVSNLLWEGAREGVKKVFGRDTFAEMANESIKRVLEDKKYVRIHDEFKKIEFEKPDVKSPRELDEDYFCSLLPIEFRAEGKEFLKRIKEEYVKIIYENANTPEMKYVLDNIKEHEDRIRVLEDIYPRIKEILEGEEIFKKRVLELKERIDSYKKEKIKDFVWKNKKDLELESLLKGGNVFICGNAGIGKTYLMIKLSELLNGIYLPLEFMESRKELELLVKEAEGKKIFIDNFQDANNEIKEYIEKGLWNVVIASRNPLDMKRDFKIIQLDWMFDEDGIIKYLGEKNIEIEKDLLKEIKDKISYPIKLRILREYLLRKELKILNRKSLKEIPEFPGELKDWYDRFVWKDFGKEERGLAFILSLLRENADIGVLSAISNISEGKIDESIGKMSGILNKVNEGYSIFHDTFKDFCAGENGKLRDKRNLHKKIGNYYESLLGIPIKSAGIKARFYGMYHYRNCFDKENFMKVFSIDLVSDLINLGEWIEAKENLEFSLNCEITARERERIVGKLGIVRCIARQMRDKSADLNANEVLANLERDDAVKKTYAKVKELCFKFGLDKLCSKRGFADDCIPTLIILYQSTENKGYLMTLAQIIYDAPDEVKQEFINMVPEIEEFLK